MITQVGILRDKVLKNIIESVISIFSDSARSDKLPELPRLLRLIYNRQLLNLMALGRQFAL